MTPGEQVIFIDHKGASHKAVVTFDLGDDRVCLEYGFKDGQRQKADNVPHIGHPSKQENNPDFPSYPLYAWKRVDEEHLELPPDHPVLDPVFQYREFRDGKEFSHNKEGELVERKRPHFDQHVRLHRAGQLKQRLTPDEVIQLGDHIQANMPRYFPKEEAPLSVGHPAHPETVGFHAVCENCKAETWRIASHQGGKVYDQKKDAEGQWMEHVCAAQVPTTDATATSDSSAPAKPEHELWCAFFNTGKECDCKAKT